MVTPLARHVGVSLLALGWFGCDAPPVEAPLIEIGQVEPASWAPGTQASIRATGLPLGREGELRLEGVLHRPGQAPVAVDQRLPVRASARGRAEALLEREWLEALGGRGTFDGRLTVRFDGPSGASVFGRREDVRIDVVPAPVAGRGSEPSIEALAAFGLHFVADRQNRQGRDLEGDVEVGADAHAEEGADGVEDANVADAPGMLHAATGAAERAGLRPGDQVTALGGVTLQMPSDRVVDGGADELHLRFRREGLRGERSLVLTRDVAVATSAAPLLPWVVAGLLLALFGTPLRNTRRHFHTFRREWSRSRPDSARALAVSAGGVVAMIALWPLGLTARAATVLALGLVTAPRPSGGWRHLPALAFVVVAPLFVGGGSVDPAGWSLLRSPLLLPLFVVALVALLKLEGARWRRAPRAAAITALVASATAEPTTSGGALGVLAVSLVVSLAVVPDRRPAPRTVALTLLVATGAVALLVLGHVHLSLPPARAGWNEMAPSVAALLLLVVAAGASARARVRAPFGL